MADDLSPEEALNALNMLRSNIVGTQSATWSNIAYPLVAILNAAGYEYIEPTEGAMREHLDAYGGAGGYPSHALREPDPGWCEPVGRLQSITEMAQRVVDDPSEENLGYLKARLRNGC